MLHSEICHGNCCKFLDEIVTKVHDQKKHGTENQTNHLTKDDVLFSSIVVSIIVCHSGTHLRHRYKAALRKWKSKVNLMV